jgi:hypothetical protein
LLTHFSQLFNGYINHITNNNQVIVSTNDIGSST